MIDDFRGPGKNKVPRDPMYGRKPTPGNSLPRPQLFTSKPVDAAATPEREEHFRTPEQVSTADSRIKLLGENHQHQELLPEHASRPKRRLFGFLSKKPSKKQAVVLSLAVLLLVGGGSAFALLRDKPEPPKPKPVPAKAVPKPQPKPILSPLTGMVVTAEEQARPVTGVMIENSADARPQSGLKDAGVVFEAIAEYGITRFLALFQEGYPENVGPVRSARPYFLDFALAFDANYAHVGGSPDALDQIRDLGVKDLDQFYNSSAYWRISQRFAPHNMYTSIPKLHEVAKTKGWTKSTFTPLPRTDKAEPAATPTARSIDLNISGAFYNVHYDYDPATNAYKRVMGGSPHTDNETGAQLSPKVVVALAMPFSLMEDGYHSMYETVGSSPMRVFQNGTVTEGTWHKADRKAQFEFKDGAGNIIQLNPGQTWFTVVKDIGQAAYAP